MRKAIFIVLCLLVACKPGNKRSIRPPRPEDRKAVLLQPLGKIPQTLISMLRDSVQAYLPVTITIAKPLELPDFAYYKPRNRYKADSLLTFLKTKHIGGIAFVAGITSKDISTKKGTINDYGIMGLGFEPGNECIVSLWRLNKDNPSQYLLQQRLLKTVVHELCHNFGLPHCANRHCVMADAEGRLNQDNETGLCAACRKKLGI
ncbi:MAG TPA: zinc-dependent metalloprotease family protein [Chitinophagaceae bacterium]|nr:zinc-dependent metalloprotease family protein [Chitinophagaceae bacterium]